jgi:predicted dienelactone hydrolase
MVRQSDATQMRHGPSMCARQRLRPSRVVSSRTGRTWCAILSTLVATILLVGPLCAPASLLAAAENTSFTGQPGPYKVEVATYDWLDKSRDREVPVKLYFPRTGAGPFPVIMFSHGLGGSREGYAYLGRHWASHGYVSVHLQHKGSDTAVWKDNPQPMESMRRAAADLSNSVNRVADVRFAIDQLTKLPHESGPLHGRLDLRHIGMAGHSFGAWTTLAIAGEVFVGRAGRETSLGDPRVKAAIAMSAPVPRNREQLDKAFAGIKIPCLHMTGTLDDSPIGETKAAERRLPFDHIHGPDQYMITFIGGDHMIFSGRARLRGDKTKDAGFQDLICIATTAFWDAHLKGDRRAMAFLTKGGLQKALGKEAAFEKKLKVP